MPSEPFLPTSRNLSIAWAEVFVKLMDHGVNELAPVLLTVTDLDGTGVASERPAIRERLDRALVEHGLQTCHTVANTIFPESLWVPGEADSARRLYERYGSIWPRVRHHHQNRRGVYFRRLTAYQPDGAAGEPVNQLQHIIDTYRQGNHRRSALQAAVFDPTRDHTNCRQQGFPCLQQVAFVPMEDEGLCVTGFYPTQYLFERAYGNYLGLSRLGRFMADQMELPFARMVCIACFARRSDSKVTKGSVEGFADDLRQILADEENA
jgi:thymidylate synthase